MGVLLLFMGCLKTSPPPPGLEPPRIAGLGEAPEGCRAAWVVLARTEVCAPPCLMEGEVYPQDSREPLSRREVRCSFHQHPGDRHGNWLVEADVPLKGRYACVTGSGEWIALDGGKPRSTPGVESAFGAGSLELAWGEAPQASWSEACIPTSRDPLLR